MPINGAQGHLYLGGDAFGGNRLPCLGHTGENLENSVNNARGS
jgi:hypothetical protein